MDLPPLEATPLVSVLTACHNGADHLHRSLGSVAAQTYPSIEHVVIDDGSSDGTAAALRAAEADHRLLRWQSIPHGGQTSAMNAAAAMARGSVWLFLDADDEYTTDKVQRCVEAFRERPRAGILTHRAAEVDAEGEWLSVFPPFTDVADGWLGERALEAGGEIGGLSATSAFGLRAEVGAELFPLPQNGSLAYTDVTLHALAPLISEVVGMDDVLTLYQWHGDNFTFAEALSVERIEQHLEVHASAAALQREFLEERNPTAAERLRPFDESRWGAEQRYLLARLRGDGDAARAAHEVMRRSGSFADQPAVRRLVWQLAPKLPDRVYLKLMEELMTPGGLRRVANSARRLSGAVSSRLGRRPARAPR
ncbi:MAG: glycosyltransferase family A protein [Actinomycetota bacterium]